MLGGALPEVGLGEKRWKCFGGALHELKIVSHISKVT